MRVRALLAAAVLLATTACTQEQPDAPEQVTLTWWDHFDHSPMADQAVTGLLARYQQEHPEVRVERRALSRDDFRTSLAEATASGAFPDIAAVDAADLPRLADRGVLADLTDRFAGWPLTDRFLGPVRESATHDGRFRGVPLRSTTTALVYDREVFERAGQAGPPTTWEGLRATARALTTGERAGLCFPASGEEATATFLPLLWQAGGDLADLATGGADALAYLDDLVNTDRSAPADVLGWTGADVAARFAEGRCAMALADTGAIPTLNQAGLDWSAAPLPGGEAGAATVLGGETWVVGGSSRHVDQAWALLTWLAETRDNATEFGGGLGALPNRSDTVDDLAWQWDPNLGGFTGQLGTARSRTAYGAKYAEISAVIGGAVADVLGGRREPGEAAGSAGDEVGRLLG
ncbi:ABC transporter substrate-binding protein [Saccharothrix syringae]|uniref:Sugar ABC transporter substrate-binding protein n=1 Tax=Saccharothrix syringae TaxID=103733 RepID=A0A5Q0GX30_SACSY|nr:sugar ABC transporter substrate-binding protein [Saccharothrix syringae]QFZ18094.1 sugar ABC transporter substrate-binding protein [Saccharothrix syringae]